MLLHDLAYRRGVELGPYPFEALPTATAPASGQIKPRPRERSEGAMAQAARFYAELFWNCIPEP